MSADNARDGVMYVHGVDDTNYYDKGDRIGVDGDISIQCRYTVISMQTKTKTKAK